MERLAKRDFIFIDETDDPGIVKWLCASDDVDVTVVFVDKHLYTGPYFSQEGDRPYDSIRFRNFVTRVLLEQHVAIRPMMSTECDLIFDRAIAESEEENLRRYLRGNYRLPRFTNVLQCDSRYVTALQFTDAIVHIAKEYLFGQRESVDGRMLNCINVFNVTNPRIPFRIALS